MGSSSEHNFKQEHHNHHHYNQHHLASLVGVVVRELEAKKQLIRKAAIRNDSKEAKKHLIDLAKSLFHLIVGHLGLDRANYNLELKNSLANLTDLKK